MKHDLVRTGNTSAPVARRALTPAQFGDLAEFLPPRTRMARQPHQSENPLNRVSRVTNPSKFPGAREDAKKVDVN
jgi:hypothetical protein